MKKYVIVLLGLIILVTGCSVTNTKKTTDKKEVDDKIAEQVIISYRSGVGNSNDDNPEYEIKLYADKHITAGYSHLDGFTNITLTDEQYRKIVDYVESDEFLSLPKDLSDSKDEGEYSYITVRYEKSVLFSVGGYNVSNEIYLELEKMLKQYS